MKPMTTNDYYMKNKKNYARKCADVKDAALKGNYDRKVANEGKYGNNEQMITIGVADRLGFNEPKKIDDIQMQTSYSYGYFERGSRVLDGNIDNGLYSEEEQRKYGIYDVIHNVPEKYLTELKKRSSYLNGRLYALGSKAYDFALENNMSLEDYVNLMGIMCPKVKTKEFIEGFISRENEIKEKNKKGSR